MLFLPSSLNPLQPEIGVCKPRLVIPSYPSPWELLWHSPRIQDLRPLHLACGAVSVHRIHIEASQPRISRKPVSLWIHIPYFTNIRNDKTNKSLNLPTTILFQTFFQTFHQLFQKCGISFFCQFKNGQAILGLFL